MRRRSLLVMAAGAVAMVIVAGAGLIAWRMNLLQRLF